MHLLQQTNKTSEKNAVFAQSGGDRWHVEIGQDQCDIHVIFVCLSVCFFLNFSVFSVCFLCYLYLFFNFSVFSFLSFWCNFFLFYIFYVHHVRFQ